MQKDLTCKFIPLTQIEVAWLAGLFEGEASFQLDKRSIKRYKISTTPPTPSIRIAMVDEDIIARVSHLVHKKYFLPSRLTVQNTVYCILCRIFPYMGKRRQLQIAQCLNAIEAWHTWYLQGGKSKMAQQARKSL